MKIGSSTFYGIIGKSALETVEELEKAGFEAIELLYEFDNLLSPEEIKKLKQKKLSYSMHCPFIGMMFAHLNPALAAPQIKLVEQSLEAAKQIGCSYYIMHGGAVPSAYLSIENKKTREFFVGLFIDRFKAIFQRYSSQGIRILIENIGVEREIGGKLEDIIRIQRAMPQLGFCFDIAHSEITGQTKDILDRLKVDYVHASDNNLERDEHKAIGKGKIDYKGIIGRLRAKGFNGKIILENLSYNESVESFKELKRFI